MTKSTKTALLLSLAGFAAKKLIENQKNNKKSQTTSVASSRSGSFTDLITENLRNAALQKWSQAVLRADSFIKSK